MDAPLQIYRLFKMLWLSDISFVQILVISKIEPICHPLLEFSTQVEEHCWDTTKFFTLIWNINVNHVPLIYLTALKWHIKHAPKL